MELLREVEAGLRRSGMAASRFGREVAGDPKLVHDMRRGRELRGPLAGRVRAYIDAACGRPCAIDLHPGRR